VQQDAAADPAPGAMLRPDLPLERFLPFDEAGAQRAGGQAIALRAARLILQRSQVDRARGEVGGLGIEAARGATRAQRVFFKTPRASSRQRHWEESEPWCRGS
jgi:hypothetical protein